MSIFTKKTHSSFILTNLFSSLQRKTFLNHDKLKKISNFSKKKKIFSSKSKFQIIKILNPSQNPT